MESVVASFWYSRFNKVGEILKSFYEHVSRSSGHIADYLVFLSLAEQAQSYPWAYIDYGFRVPVYRTLQWLYFTIKPDLDGFIKWIKRSRKRGWALGRYLVSEIYRQLSKEYVFLWSEVMGVAHGDEDTLSKLSKIIKEVLGMEKEPIELERMAFEDLAGLKNELKACYVLIDRRKPFLPFSIMQAPIVPSHVRPGLSSGDIYLFEENLVVDIKGGWIDSKTKQPTYYYNSKYNLSMELKRIADLHYLYGIRKAIGVVADEEKHIHLAIYVPWRLSREEGSLLHLKSIKPPLLVYMNKSTDKGIEPHKAEIKGGELTVSIDAYLLDNELKIDEKTVSLKIIGEEELEAEYSEARVSGRKLQMIFGRRGGVDKVFEVNNVMLAVLNVKLEDLNETLSYPILLYKT
ncbi:hypothetical protein [Thermogladius calderae]|uniref:hypothetical protein n=1 Tax=Thermogladius calderae TaxID=1200300 RepID=UPI00064F8B3A|nr:hypothetical protein [Thermogladius calderae]